MPSQPESLFSIVERGTIRIPFTTPDFTEAVRGLLENPLLEDAVTPAAVGDVVDCVLKREQAGSTCAGSIALPHARSTDVAHIVAGLGVNREGIYGEGTPRVMLAFVSPQDAAGDHLRFLSAAAKAFRDPKLLDRVQSANNREDVLALLRSAGV